MDGLIRERAGIDVARALELTRTLEPRRRWPLQHALGRRADGVLAHAVLAEAAASADRVDVPVERVRALAHLAADGVDRARLTADAFAIAGALADGEQRSTALAALAPVLGEDEVDAALLSALEIGDEWWRAQGIACLARRLPEASARRALARVRTFEHPMGRADALAALAPRLPPEEALAIVADLTWGPARTTALVELARTLPTPGLAVALDLLDPDMPVHQWLAGDRIEILGHLAPRLPHEQLLRACSMARDLLDGRDISTAHTTPRSGGLEAIMALLPAGDLARLADAEIDRPDAGRHFFQAMSGRLADLPAPVTRRIWTGMLETLGNETRSRAFELLSRTLPFLAALGGDAALIAAADEVRRVTRWFP